MLTEMLSLKSSKTDDSSPRDTTIISSIMDSLFLYHLSYFPLAPSTTLSPSTITLPCSQQSSKAEFLPSMALPCYPQKTLKDNVITIFAKSPMLPVIVEQSVSSILSTGKRTACDNHSEALHYSHRFFRYSPVTEQALTTCASS